MFRLDLGACQMKIAAKVWSWVGAKATETARFGGAVVLSTEVTARSLRIHRGARRKGGARDSGRAPDPGADQPALPEQDDFRPDRPKI